MPIKYTTLTVEPPYSFQVTPATAGLMFPTRTPDTLDVPAFHAWQVHRMALRSLATSARSGSLFEFYMLGHTLIDVERYAELLSNDTPMAWAVEWLGRQVQPDFVTADMLWDEAIHENEEN